MKFSGLFDGSLASRLEPWSFALLRFTVGILLMPYGAQKILGWFGGDRAAFLSDFHKIGLEPAALFLNVSGSIELFGGLLIALGLFTRPASFVSAGMLATTILVTSRAGWIETVLPILWTVSTLFVFFRGPGKLSFDHLFDHKQYMANLH